MRLLFIRHADPDYTNDSLTPTGRKEAELLAKAAPDMNLGTCYVSPLGRAQETARYCMETTGKTAETLDWLQEFPSNLDLEKAVDFQDAYTRVTKDGQPRVPVFWDIKPSFWTEEPIYMDPVHWRESPLALECDIASPYDHVTAEFDRLLATFGYVREGGHYRVEKESTETLTFFCHFAISSALISHLWNVSPFTLWFNTITPPTGVSELFSEERVQGFARFRAQRIGDISHLYAGGTGASFSGRFCECFSQADLRH